MTHLAGLLPTQSLFCAFIAVLLASRKYSTYKMQTEDSSGLPVDLASLPDGVIAHIMEAARPGDVIRLSAVHV